MLVALNVHIHTFSTPLRPKRIESLRMRTKLAHAPKTFLCKIKMEK